MKFYQIDFIRPKLLNSKGVKSWFTPNNAENINTDDIIKGLNLGFNTKSDSKIINQNRLILAQNIDTDLGDIAFANQVHGAEIKFTPKGGNVGNYDGLITNAEGVALAIQIADCAAILFADKENKVIGAAHAGWRGAVNQIPTKMIEKMGEYGALQKNIKCYISPCISLENFEVGREVADQFPDQFVDYTTFSKPHVNLREYVKHQLIQAGISRNNIEVSPDCTVDNRNYYSYRREKDKSGRMMAIIKLT